MSRDQPGLRLRMLQEARRIVSQHRQLDQFQEQVSRALRHKDAGQVLEIFTQFREALEAHIRMEEVTHFPALHGLHPDWDAQLTELVREHTTFRRNLAETHLALERGQLADFEQGFEAFVRALMAHEAAEEWLFGEIAPHHEPTEDSGS